MLARCLMLLVLLSLAACAVSPAGEAEEREKAASAYLAPEAPPDLPKRASLEEVLRRAYLANGDLQRAYWEWRAAIEEIPQAGSLRTNLAFSFQQMFENGSTSWDQTILGVQTDPMANIPWPGKLSRAASRALEIARAAGHRFENARLELIARTTGAWLEFALAAEEIRLQESNAALAATSEESIEARVRAGRAPQQDLLKARNALDLARNGLETRRARLVSARARLNGLLRREPTAPLDAPAELPSARELPFTDAQLLSMAAERNPELAALAREAAGRDEAVALMRLEWLPEFSGGFSWDLGGVARSVMAMLTAPVLRYEAVQAGIEQAKAELEAARAARRQAEADIKARTIANLSDFRNVERQVGLYRTTILPRTDQIVESARVAYAAGQVPAIELLDAQRSSIEIRLMLADLRMEREKLLAEIEALTGLGLTIADNEKK